MANKGRVKRGRKPRVVLMDLESYSLTVDCGRKLESLCQAMREQMDVMIAVTAQQRDALAGMMQLHKASTELLRLVNEESARRSAVKPRKPRGAKPAPAPAPAPAMPAPAVPEEYSHAAMSQEADGPDDDYSPDDEFVLASQEDHQ